MRVTVTVRKAKKEDFNEPKTVLLEAVVLPDGEIVRYGGSIGFINKDLKGVYVLNE